MIGDSHLQAIADLGLAMLRRRLPGDWALEAAIEDAAPRASTPHVAWLAVPDRRRIRVRLQVVRELVATRIHGLEATTSRGRSPLLIIAPLLDRDARHGLIAEGINFVDLSGNIHFSLRRPPISIEAQTVSAVRVRQTTPLKLSGSKIARVVRTLCDFRTPTDCARVASHADISTAHATDIVRALASEGFLVMTGAQRIESADWTALLRRWSDDDRARAREFKWYVARAGIASLTSKLRNRHDCVVSGPWAANVFAPVASKQVLLCYVRDEQRLVEQLDLAPADTAGNVAVSTRFSESVTKGTSEYRDIRIAALSQIAADLLTLSLNATARPVLEWMRHNERSWRL